MEIINRSSRFWPGVKEIFNEVSNQFDDMWQKRKRTLNSQILVSFLLKLVESKNTQGYGSNLAEFWESCLEKGISLPQDKAVSASSLCASRSKLPEDIFIVLNKALLEHWNNCFDLPNFRGYRLFAIDGSRINIPRELIKEGYKLYDEKRGRYYPQGLLSFMYNIQEKVIYDYDFVPHMNERLCALQHMKTLGDKDIMIFDRGYFSYLLFYRLLEHNVQGIFRLQQGGSNEAILNFWQSEDEDKIIEYNPSTTVKYDLKKQGYNLDFKTLKIRLIKHKIGDQTYVYATTLMDQAQFPAGCFAEIYHERWSIEEIYKVSKRFIEIEDFHSKSERGVKQELYAHILLINLSRFFEFEAQNLIPPVDRTEDDKYRSENKYFKAINIININFKNCIQVVSRNLGNLILGSCNIISNLVNKIIVSISRIRQKTRPNRHYTRISHKPMSRWIKYRNQCVKT
jgi:hypothetical protein